ncbi:hypothetical protein E2986_12347 [Frieseomelitta varia]|uniref:Uncharacterized protein n=1 Tax=Frieseomelitta varia TaxID=561572 RepID=A0A833SFC2_9HYME|nr:hypothetical protein E2986_12347 [Frieseomelitta varia]
MHSFRYYLKLETWLSISIVGISLAVSIGTYCHLSASSLTSIFEGNELHDNYRQYPPQWIFHSVSVAILLASVQTMVLIGRLPQWGYYTLVSFTEGTFLWSVLNSQNDAFLLVYKLDIDEKLNLLLYAVSQYVVAFLIRCTRSSYEVTSVE